MELNRERLSQDLQRRFADRPGVVAIFLFGSHAAGRAGPLSDVDLAVLAPVDLHRKAREEIRLAAIGELLDLFPNEEVDVVLLNDAPLALQYNILRDGILLFCRNREQRVLFEAQAISMYLDFKPALDYREARVLERARRGELTRGPNPHRRAFEHHRQQRERAAADAGDAG